MHTRIERHSNILFIVVLPLTSNYMQYDIIHAHRVVMFLIKMALHHVRQSLHYNDDLNLKQNSPK